MPVRPALTLAVTVVGLFLLFNFKTPDGSTARAHMGAPAVSSPPPASSTAGGPASSPQATATPTAASAWRDGTFTGQDASNEYGDVQVSVTLSAGRITAVKALQLPSDRRRSEFISEQAGPILHDEVLQAQSGQIDTVSGATYTSESYAQSVQSALDQAHR